MYYIEKENKILFVDEDRDRLIATLSFQPELSEDDIKEVPEGYTIKDFQLMTIEEAEEEKQEQQKQERNKEIEEKIKELQIMALPEILNGNTENIKLYNDVIASLLENKS